MDVVLSLLILIVITVTLRAERSIEEAATRHSHEVPMLINVDSGRIWGTLGLPKGAPPQFSSVDPESL